jgi:single-strand DNA-binding protein
MTVATYPHVNEVRLVGRLSGTPEWRFLPSGDELAEWRLVIERTARSPGVGRRVAVDTVSCVSFDEAVRGSARAWRHGDVLSVLGELRRRFWRAGDRPVSRYQVEVHRAEPLARGPDEG